MKKITALFVAIIAIITLVPTSVFGADGNLGGDGGSLGNAVNNYYWNPTYCGARITVITEGGSQIGESFDWLNSSCYGNATYHFGKHSKLYYRGIANVNQMPVYYGDYGGEHVAGMPMIVLSSGSNISQIRSYFTSNGTLQVIAARVGASYSVIGDDTHSSIWVSRGGKSVKCCVVIEPVVAVMCGGKPLTCTATELALYAQANAGVQNYLASIYRMQAPLAIYLQYPQLGFAANSDTSVSWRSRADVISYLGVGVVSFGKDGASFTPSDDNEMPNPTVDTPPTTYNYHTDTEVYTSVKVTNNTGGDIKSGTDITFHITGNGVDETHTARVVLPNGKSQLAYCRWTTPATPGTYTVEITARAGITLSTSSVSCNTTTFGATEPPDPKVTDTNPTFMYAEPGIGSASMAHEWGHWEWTTGEAEDAQHLRYYAESGQTYFTKWKENAFISNTQYKDTVLQELTESQHYDAEYQTTSDWSTPQYVDGYATPPDSDFFEYRTISTDGYFRTRTRTKAGCIYDIVSYNRTTMYNYMVIAHYSSWSNNGATTNNLTGTTPYAEYPYRWVYAYSKGETYKVKGVEKFRYRYYYNQQIYRETSSSTSYTTTTSPQSGYTSGSTRYEYILQSTYIQEVMTGSAGTYTWYGDSAPYQHNGQIHFQSATLKQVYENGRVIYSPWTAWSAWQLGSPQVADTITEQFEHKTMTKYVWRSRLLLTPEHTDYTYRQRSSYWYDTGSYWYGVEYTPPLTSTSYEYRWMWVEEGAALGSTATMTADSRNPTAHTVNGATYVKSGYGVNLTLNAYLTAKNTEAVTGVQNAIAYFPEFRWTTYSRKLEETSNGKYEFAVNEYSRYGSRVHFTPIWYSDGAPYLILVKLNDCWTPAGELYDTETSNRFIVQGDVYDDWYVTPHE